MKKNYSFPIWITNIKAQLIKIHLPSKFIFFALGILSTIWFLIRVIPKPSRAGYPCMRTAAPFMSGFIIYLLTLSGSLFAFKKARAKLLQSKYIAAGTLFIASLASVFIFFSTQTDTALAKTNNAQALVKNAPIGVGQGIFPGRVVWVHDKDATNKNCTNTYISDGISNENDDGWFLDKNNDQSVIDQMLFDNIINLTGESNLTDGWSAIFNYFNKKKYSTASDYTSSEKIFIKTNFTSSYGKGESWGGITNDLYKNENTSTYAIAETSPHIILSLLRQLVDSIGISEDMIYVGDPLKLMYNEWHSKWDAEYPNVHYVANEAGPDREAVTPYPLAIMKYSDKGDVLSVYDDSYYQEMVLADYLINVATMKAHARAGITLFAKNHFGSHTRTDATHLHNGLVAPDGGVPSRTSYGIYRVQVDLMGHESIGGNTLLYLLDALYSGSEATDPPVKFTSSPFNGDWTSSIFTSLDPVAIESVAFDFLRTEFNGLYTYPEISKTVNYPNYAGVDDYLEQAASSTNWPSSISYDPENDGLDIESLGVHEHWKNSTDKSYKRNLGFDEGIELVSIPSNLVINDIKNNKNTLDGLSFYPVPANNYTTLQLNNQYIGNISIEVLDITGKRLNSYQTTKTEQSLNYKINLNGISASNLIVRVSGDDFTASKQISKLQ